MFRAITLLVGVKLKSGGFVRSLILNYTILNFIYVDVSKGSQCTVPDLAFSRANLSHDTPPCKRFKAEYLLESCKCTGCPLSTVTTG